MARVTILGPDNQPVDWSTVAAWDGEGGGRLTPGNYLFEVAGVAQEPASTGNLQLVIDLMVVQGLETEVHNGASTKHWLSLTPKAAGRVKQFLDAIGVVPDADGTFEDQEFISRQFMAEVFEDEYNKVDPLTGQSTVKKTSKIRKEMPVEGAAPAAAPTPAPAPAPRPAAPARATAPALPAGPRVASLPPRPGVRLPVPAKR